MNANWINEAAIESASNQQWTHNASGNKFNPALIQTLLKFKADFELKFPVYYNSIYLVDCNKNLMKETKYA